VKTTDKQFYMAFTLVLVALVVLTLFVAFVANVTGSKEVGDKTAHKLQQAKERIKPVGQVNLASSPSVDAQMNPSTSSVAVTTVAAVTQSGEQVYNGICQSCHTIGLLDAPKVGDKAAWKARLATGVNALYASSINGKGMMPAKGGNPALSDADIKAAVDYMLEKSK
jgi:cytochrome c5